MFGNGIGPIMIDELNCTGTEASLADCGFDGWGVGDCSHSEDAGVRCQTGKHYKYVDTPVLFTAILMAKKHKPISDEKSDVLRILAQK